MARGLKVYLWKPVIASSVIQQKGWRATDSCFALMAHVALQPICWMSGEAITGCRKLDFGTLAMDQLLLTWSFGVISSDYCHLSHGYSIGRWIFMGYIVCVIRDHVSLCISNTVITWLIAVSNQYWIL